MPIPGPGELFIKRGSRGRYGRGALAGRRVPSAGRAALVHQLVGDDPHAREHDVGRGGLATMC